MAHTFTHHGENSTQHQITYRQEQLRQLATFYNTRFPIPRILVAHGLEEVGKLATITALLHARKLKHIVVKSQECLNQRQLLAKIFARFVSVLDEEVDIEGFERTDNINALATNLKRLLEGYEERIVLVVDGIDGQSGASSTLLPALARLGDIVPGVAVILTSCSSRALPLHKSGVPYVKFPLYSRSDAVQIVVRGTRMIVPDDYSDDGEGLGLDKIRQIHTQFVAVVYDTLCSTTTVSITKCQNTCAKLWPNFIYPALYGTASARKQQTFTKLLSQRRALFQNIGEDALQHSLAPQPAPIFGDISGWTFDELRHSSLKANERPSQTTVPTNTTSRTRSKEAAMSEQANTGDLQQPLLKHFATLILLSAYLASHTPAKQDIVLFSRLSSSSIKKRKYLTKSRSGGISKSPAKSTLSRKPSKAKIDEAFDPDIGDAEVTTPSKKASKASDATPKKERADRSMRAIFEKTSNIARPFTLERLIAIVRAIHPDGLTRGTADRVYAEMAELERLRLVCRVRSASGDDGVAGGVAMLEERWRCIVSRAVVVDMGRFWSLGLDGWEIE